MDSNLLNFLLSFGSGVAANLTTTALQAAFQKVLASRPEIEAKLSAPQSPTDFQEALGDLAGALEALAGSGSIAIDGSVITALREARFDHQSGKVTIGNSLVNAPLLQTGGTGSGQTVIGGNTELKSAGTSIKVGHGASIVITGNAGVKQS